MILAIDFDGTIHDPLDKAPGQRLGKPIYGAQEAIQHLFEEGHTIIIHTVWATTPERVKAIMDWCDYFVIPFHSVTALKPTAHIYIDDHGYHFDNWEDTVNVVDMMQSLSYK